MYNTHVEGNTGDGPAQNPLNTAECLQALKNEHIGEALHVSEAAHKMVIGGCESNTMDPAIPL